MGNRTQSSKISSLALLGISTRLPCLIDKVQRETDDCGRDGWRLNEELQLAGTNVEGKPTAAGLHLNR